MFEDFPFIAVRAAEAGHQIGDYMPHSYVWMDGERIEDEPLPGACGIRVQSEADLAEKIEDVRQGYGWGDRVLYLIGGHSAEMGSDDGEIIINRAVVLRIIG